MPCQCLVRPKDAFHNPSIGACLRLLSYSLIISHILFPREKSSCRTPLSEVWKVNIKKLLGILIPDPSYQDDWSTLARCSAFSILKKLLWKLRPFVTSSSFLYIFVALGKPPRPQYLSSKDSNHMGFLVFSKEG